jgi:thioredoxin-dependent peroxiredoxin
MPKKSSKSKSKKLSKSRKLRHKKIKHSQKRSKLEQMEGKSAPCVNFITRVRDDKLKNKSNPYKWKTIKSNNLFKNKKSVVFSLPGAFTPTCSKSQLPDYDKYYNKLKQKGINDVYCISVNDSFVMNNWKKNKKVKHVKMLPDGNAEFTKKMGALVKKRNLGFGNRSWRYSMLIDNGKIVKIFSEPNMSNNHKTDPFVKSDVHTMLKYL